MEIIQERLKRNSESALTKYSVLYHKKVGAKTEKPNGLIDNGSKLKSQSTLNMIHKRFPIFQPVKRELGDNYLNGTVQYAYTPITMVLIEQNKTENKNNVCEKPFAVIEKKVPDAPLSVKQEQPKNERVSMDDDGFKWPGVHEVMEAYHKYAKGKVLICFVVFLYWRKQCWCFNKHFFSRKSNRNTRP